MKLFKQEYLENISDVELWIDALENMIKICLFVQRLCINYPKQEPLIFSFLSNFQYFRLWENIIWMNIILQIITGQT